MTTQSIFTWKYYWLYFLLMLMSATDYLILYINILPCWSLWPWLSTHCQDRTCSKDGSEMKWWCIMSCITEIPGVAQVLNVCICLKILCLSQSQPFVMMRFNNLFIWLVFFIVISRKKGPDWLKSLPQFLYFVIHIKCAFYCLLFRYWGNALQTNYGIIHVFKCSNL